MFNVLFQWQLDEDHLNEFKEGWTAIIRHNIQHYGALGSRLHHCEDGTWISYSQWPSKAHWQRSKDADSLDKIQASRAKMRLAICKQYEPILMLPQLDHLISTELDGSNLV